MNQVLENCNSILSGFGKPLWKDASDLYATTEEPLLFTIPQLDPHGPRPKASYLGIRQQWNGQPPQWPEFPGPKIWGYLKPFPALPQLLGLLVELRRPTIIVSDGIDPGMQRRFARPWLRFENNPLDMRIVLQTCDVGICNANHGTSMALLGAGKPALYIPLHLEQVLTAHAINQLGLGKAASPRKPEQVALRLLELLNNPSILETTTQFAQHLNEINHSELLSLSLDRLAIRAE
jgi:hypothetical protein